MVVLLLSVFLIGAILGMRFKVLILVPALACTLSGVLAVNIVCGGSFSDVVIQATLALTGLQVGYFCGVVLGSPAAQSHFFHPRSVSLHSETNR